MVSHVNNEPSHRCLTSMKELNSVDTPVISEPVNLLIFYCNPAILLVRLILLKAKGTLRV